MISTPHSRHKNEVQLSARLSRNDSFYPMYNAHNSIIINTKTAEGCKMERIWIWLVGWFTWEERDKMKE